MKTSSLCALFAACLAISAFGFEPDVIIDANDHPSSVELSPSASWGNETTVTNAFRGASKVRNNSIATDFARFHVTLPAEGPWHVFIWHNQGATTSVSASVTHAVATTNVTYSQSSTNAGQWMLLGTYWFNSTSEAEVRVTGAATKLSADAVRFSFASADVVLDSPASGITYAPSGAWVSVGHPAGNQQALMRTNSNNATATFQPVIPTDGEYEISVWLPPTTGAWLPGGGVAVSSLTVDVYARNGVITTHSIPLPASGVNEGRWVQIGNAPFLLSGTPPVGQPNPNPAKVVIKAGTTGGLYVPTDAVRWSKVSSYEVYMDNEFGTVLGTWETYSTPSALAWGKLSAARYGAAYRAVSSVSGGEHSVKYTPTINDFGYYDVYVYYPLHNPDYPYFNHYASTFTVRAATANWGAADVSRVINQQVGAGMWTHAGKYILYSSSDADSSKRPWLKITAPPSTGGKIIADGVLVLRDDEDRDSDGDGLPDWYEVLLATSTSTVDLNGDGIPDGWDTDGDGMSDGDEHRLGRNPLMTAANGSSLMSLQVHTPTFR